MEFFRTKYNYSKTLAVIAKDDDGSPYGTATVYLEGQSEGLPKDEAFVDTNNWPSVIDDLEKAGLATETEKSGASGYCVYPVMKFNLDKIKELK
jgi:hypothetical protein